MAVIGGAGVPTLPQITINKSQTWVPPQDGTVCIHVVAAGGSGASATTYYGGGAGAYAKIPSLAVTTAGSFTLVVGVGGAGTEPSSNEGLFQALLTKAGRGTQEEQEIETGAQLEYMQRVILQADIRIGGQ